MRAVDFAAAMALLTAATASSAVQADIAFYQVSGDGILEPLDGRQGDAVRGRRVFLDRGVGNCLACHAAPVEDEPFKGNIGPSLSGIGGRLTSAQLRLRLVDARRLNPETLMPPYHRIDNLVNVSGTHRGKPILTAQEVEDVVAYLDTFRN